MNKYSEARQMPQIPQRKPTPRRVFEAPRLERHEDLEQMTYGGFDSLGAGTGAMS